MSRYCLSDPESRRTPPCLCIPTRRAVRPLPCCGGRYIAYNYISGVTFARKELLKMLPYVVTIPVLIFTSSRNKRENQPPAGLGLNYYREDR